MTAITVPAQIMRDDGTTMLDGQITFPDGAPGGTVPALWQMSADVTFAVDTTGLLGNLFLGAAFDPTSEDYGKQSGAFAYPAFTYGATDTIATFGSLSISLSAPSSVDSLTVIFTLVVTDGVGTNIVSLGGTVGVAEGDTTASLASTAITADAVAGVDLAYDAATGLVTTTAGGIYACAGVIAVGWA